MWSELHKLLGIKAKQTTSYHPQANGMVERLHRQLKASLMAVDDKAGWMVALPLVLLGLRSSWKHDLDASPCEMVYGEAVHLPGEFFSPSNPLTCEPSSSFADDLRSKMSQIQAKIPSFHLAETTRKPDDPLLRFAGIDRAYVRIDAVKPPLTRPYSGPFRILTKSPKYFELKVKNRVEKISVDRLKPARCSPAPPASSAPPKRTLSDINQPCLNQIGEYQ